MFSHETPLWFYILAEAEIQGNGKLGVVGSRIVAETIVQLLFFSENSILQEAWEEDDDSWLNLNGTFGMPDLLRFIQQTQLKYSSLLYPHLNGTFDELNPLGDNSITN